MMSGVITGMAVLSVICGLMNGSIGAVSNAVLGGCTAGVELAFSLAGTLALWSGVMETARRSGLTKTLSRVFLPVTGGLLFPGLRRDSPALEAISMNMTANLLGLGNAATPLGITAMKALEQETGGDGTASPEMVTFVVLNTASLQLLPTTSAYLRLKAGSANPMEIVPAVWMVSAGSLTVSLLAAKLPDRRKKRRLPP